MKKIVRHWWQACFAGLLVGIPTGIALEFARGAYNDSVASGIAREFNSQGVSPPLMIDSLQPWFIPFLTAGIFTLFALVVYVVLVRVR